jgi:hypothetical protein
MKTLNVVKTNRYELEQMWGLMPSLGGELFIRCNAKAEINWDKAPVYTWKEIQQEQKKRPVHFLVPKEIFTL